jgi:hypothetical protein
MKFVKWKKNVLFVCLFVVGGGLMFAKGEYSSGTEKSLRGEIL